MKRDSEWPVIFRKDSAGDVRKSAGDAAVASGRIARARRGSEERRAPKQGDNRCGENTATQ